VNATSSFFGQFDRKVLDGCSNTKEENERYSILPPTSKKLARVVSEGQALSYVNSSIASDRRAPSKASQSWNATTTRDKLFS
jgi:hypothetical protein